MSQQGKFRIATFPGDVFVGTVIGDLTVYSTNGVFLGAVPAGVTAKAHIKLDEEGVVVNEPMFATQGVTGDVATGSIVPQVSASGIQVSSGAGTIRLDAVVVDDAAVSCATLAATTSTTTATANVGVAVVMPTATFTCPPGKLALTLNPAAPVLEIKDSAGSAASVRVGGLLAQSVQTENALPFNVKDSLLVDADATIGTSLAVVGATVVGTSLAVGTSLTTGDGLTAPLYVRAPYLGVDTMTQVPSLRLGGAANVVLDPSQWGARQAARVLAGTTPSFVEVDGVVLVGPVRATNPVAVRHIGGTVSAVHVDNGLMTRYAPAVVGTCTLVDATGLISGTTSMNARSDIESSRQVAAPSYRVLGGATANEVVMTGTSAGLRSDKNVVAPSFTVEGACELTPISGGGVHASTKANVPQLLIRNATDASTVATQQTDFDGAARVVAPALRLQGAMEVQILPTAGGTRIQPGVLDLAYNTTLATIAHLRVQALEDGLHLHTPRVFFEDAATSLVSSAATGTLTTSNLPTLSLNGICALTATTAAGVSRTSIDANVLQYGRSTTVTTQQPETGGVLMGPSADFTMRATTRLAMQAPSSIGMVIRRPDLTWSRFEFQAGSKGELRVNNRDIGLTPYDAFSGAAAFSAPDVDGWYTYTDALSATVFRARRYDLGRPALLRAPAEQFVLPGFVESLFSGTAETIFVNPLGGTGTFRGAWADVQFPKSLSLKRLQTTLLSANQSDRRPSVWRLYGRLGAPGIGQVATNWVELLRGGVSETTDPADKELQVYDTFRLAVSIVTSGEEVRISQLNLWGVDAAPTTTPMNSFTGQHYVVPSPGAELSEFLPGMVVVAAGGGHDSVASGGFKARGGAAAITSDAALPRVDLSRRAGDKRVFGVVDSVKANLWVTQYEDRRLVVNSLGEGAVLVVDTNGPIESGDLLQSSRVAGHAERQDGDAVTSRTVGKATMDCDFVPGDVPRQRISWLASGGPALDADGLVIWEDDGVEREPEYAVQHLFSQACRSALISCTYRCG